MPEPTDRRQEALLRLFGIKAHFDRMAVEWYLLLRQRQGLAGGNTQLPFDQIEPGDHLGHRMLDLQARVHFHDIEVHGTAGTGAVTIAIVYALDGAGADQADHARGIAGRLPPPLAPLPPDTRG